MKKIFLNLGKQPITNNFLKKLDKKNKMKEFFYPLKLTYDDKTNLVSLSTFIKPKMMFNDNYAHRASMSKTMNNSFKTLSNKLKQKFKPSKILEIGSNDGVFIKNFPKHKVVAVEPCANLARITNKMGYKTFQNFWNKKIAKKIITSFGKVDLIFSANTISHIPNLEDVFSSIKIILNKQGVFIMEDPHLLSVLKNTSYDQFYDEHAHVFSLMAIKNIISKHSLKIFEVEKLDTHGGSLRYYITHNHTNYKIKNIVNKILKSEKFYKLNSFSTYRNFAKRVIKSKNNLKTLLLNLKKKKKIIVSYGATYKSATIFNYCNINNKLIDYVIDTTKNKQYKFTPGSHLKIYPPDQQPKKKVDYYFLGAWNFKKEILKKERNFIKKGGKFISHVPKVKIFTK